MSTFDNLGTASAQLAALLERGEYDRLAQLLDGFELQVRASAHTFLPRLGRGNLAGCHAH